MKARSLVLILLFCVMSFTGFGTTTADLTENSNLEMLTDAPEVSINVVSPVTFEVAPVVTLNLSKDLSVTPEKSFDELFKAADLAFNDQNSAELASLAVPPDLFTNNTSLTFAASSSQPLKISPVYGNSDVGWRLWQGDRLKFLCFHSS